MPRFRHHAWRMDPGISVVDRTWPQWLRMVFPGAGSALGIYTAFLGVKTLLGYPYLFDGGHKTSFTRILGLGGPHAVVGGHHGDHGDGHGDGHGDSHGASAHGSESHGHSSSHH